MRMCTYLVCILLWVCVPLANCAGFTPIVSRLQTEANFVRAAFEENAVVPSFGLEQLQLASNMLSNLWKHAEENIITVEKRTIPIPPTEKNENRRTKIPRGVSATNYVLNDCNIGKAHFSNESVDTCDNGLLCKVIEVLCTIDGSPVYIAAPVNGSVTNFNWSRCEVTKINCILDLNEDIEQMYDLREQYGASNCTPVPEATSCFSLFNRDPYPSCYVQLLCNDFLNIGYNSYGLKCESDELICGSTVITNLQSSTFGSHQSDVINGKCQLYRGGCVVPYNNNPTCTLFNYTCGFESYLGINRNNSCLLQRYDVPCAQPDSQSSNCIISQITCNGGITYDTSQPIPDQDHCFVSKITCDGNTVTVSPTNCVPTTMVCNGVEAYFSTYTGALSQCQMDQLTCPTQSNCTTLQFACPQAPKCQVNQLPCQVQCQQQLNTTTCICPDDRTGIKCQKEAPITCDANLFHPPINCLPSPLPDPNDKYLNGDRKCTVYDNYNAEADLGFMLNCHYDEEYSPNSENKQYNFTYWASNGNISFSNPVQWSLRQKIYNFNQLSDNNAVLVTPQLTASQLLGEEPVWFNFSLANIPDKYWLARRLYYEVDFNYSGYAPASTSSRGFIDAPTRPISSAKMRKINVVALVFSLVGVLVFLGLVGYFGYKYYRFYRKQHPVSRH